MLSIFQFLTLGAYPWAKVHQKERWATIHLDLPSCKISARSRSIRDMRYQSFSLFGVGANPWAKIHQRGDDLVDSEIYHPAKFHRSMPTRARDICYQKSCGHTHTQTNKKTVNDISPACLSVCGDRKSAQSNLGRGMRRGAVAHMRHTSPHWLQWHTPMLEKRKFQCWKSETQAILLIDFDFTYWKRCNLLTLTSHYGKCNQEKMYQTLSELASFCKRYDKNILVFFSSQF